MKVTLIIESTYAVFFLVSPKLRNYIRQDLEMLGHTVVTSLTDIDIGLASLIRPLTARSGWSNPAGAQLERELCFQLEAFPTALERRRSPSLSM
jgi:hypothetical protein